ncbi:MAG: hypothetical protein R3B55_01420 [Candidatus Paceibacterota bacterium]
MISNYEKLKFDELIQIISLPSPVKHEEAWTVLKKQCIDLEGIGLQKIVDYYNSTENVLHKLALYNHMDKDPDFSSFEIHPVPEIRGQDALAGEILPYEEGKVGICD